MNLNRYKSHLNLGNIGKKGQNKILKKKVLCVGLGGLGSLVSFILLSSGVRNLGLIDGDLVEIENLSRQILFYENDVGKSKVLSIKKKLELKDSKSNIKCFNFFLNKKNALEIIKRYDIVVDCSDNFRTRLIINDICKKIGKPNITAAVSNFEGYVSVFQNRKNEDPCFRCIFEKINEFSNKGCLEIGVLSSMVTLISSIQAHQVIQLILEKKTLRKKLLTINSNMRIVLINLEKNKRCKFCFNYLNDNFIKKNKYISLKNYLKIKKKKKIILIDVRDYEEFKKKKIKNSINIPIKNFHFEIEKLNLKKNYLIFCSHGFRSEKAFEIMKKKKFKKIYILKNGISFYEKNFNIFRL